jgi:hypothetical protein
MRKPTKGVAIIIGYEPCQLVAKRKFIQPWRHERERNTKKNRETVLQA